MSVPGSSQSESRAGRRLRTYLQGRALWGAHGALWSDCLIRDMSADGAKLRVTGAIPPPTFFLVVVKHGLGLQATQQWREGDLIGVRFDVRHDLNKPLAQELTYLREVWQAIAPR